MKVSLNGDMCQGHGRCYEIASEVFTDDERGHGVVTQSEVDGDLARLAEDAAMACPERAITIEA